jgi:hypothetical protein
MYGIYDYGEKYIILKYSQIKYTAMIMIFFNFVFGRQFVQA